MAVLDCNNIKLQKGSKGENVKTLQTHLTTLKYYTRQIDGDYGVYTQSAVKEFQKAYKLTVDGWVGKETCQKLTTVVNEVNQSKTQGTNINIDCPNISLKRGSKGEDVKKLQTMLKAFNYYTRQIDGDYGVYTEQAVKAYQKSAGHDPDGWFGPKTCKTLTKKYNDKFGSNAKDTTEELTKEYLKQVTAKLTVLPTVVVLPESEFDTGTGAKKVTEGSLETETNFDCSKVSLKKGSKGDDVKKLQTVLKARGYYTRQIDGDFGTYTQNAVIQLQRKLGVKTDGWFGGETCKALQKDTNTGEAKSNKNTNYVIKDFKSVTTSDDIEGLSHEVTITTPYTVDKMNRVRRLQKTQFDMYLDNDVIYTHEGYINEIKVTQEDDTMIMEMTMCGYNVFLDQQVEFEKTAKRSELIKEICTLCGLKAEVDTTGLDDSEYTIKVQKQAATTSSSAGEGGSGLTQMSGNDCTPTNPISAYSFDVDTCKGGTKIGNSSANYARDTANMTAKEALQDLFRRFKYGLRGSGTTYSNNKYCPQSMWNKNGTIWGNCADAARLTKALMEVHGLKVGIHHWSSGSIGHYFNVIEIDGKTYRYDCCFGSSGYSKGYGNELCNNLTKNGGPWSL